MTALCYGIESVQGTKKDRYIQSGKSYGFSRFVLDTPPHSEGLKKIPNLKKKDFFFQ